VIEPLLQASQADLAHPYRRVGGGHRLLQHPVVGLRGRGFQQQRQRLGVLLEGGGVLAGKPQDVAGIPGQQRFSQLLGFPEAVQRLAAIPNVTVDAGQPLVHSEAVELRPPVTRIVPHHGVEERPSLAVALEEPAGDLRQPRLERQGADFWRSLP